MYNTTRLSNEDFSSIYSNAIVQSSFADECFCFFVPLIFVLYRKKSYLCHIIVPFWKGLGVFLYDGFSRI